MRSPSFIGCRAGCLKIDIAPDIAPGLAGKITAAVDVDAVRVAGARSDGKINWKIKRKLAAADVIKAVEADESASGKKLGVAAQILSVVGASGDYFMREYTQKHCAQEERQKKKICFA